MELVEFQKLIFSIFHILKGPKRLTNLEIRKFVSYKKDSVPILKLLFNDDLKLKKNE